MTPDTDQHPAPVPVGGHIVQDNVSDPANPEARVGTTPTVQSNVEGVETTTHGDGTTSSHQTVGDTPSYVDAGGVTMPPPVVEDEQEPVEPEPDDGADEPDPFADVDAPDDDHEDTAPEG